MENDNKEPYVLVSVFKDDVKPEEVSNAAPALSLLIDEWHNAGKMIWSCLLYTSPSPRDRTRSRMPSSA